MTCNSALLRRDFSFNGELHDTTLSQVTGCAQHIVLDSRYVHIIHTVAHRDWHYGVNYTIQLCRKQLVVLYTLYCMVDKYIHTVGTHRHSKSGTGIIRSELHDTILSEATACVQHIVLYSRYIHSYHRVQSNTRMKIEVRNVESHGMIRTTAS